MKKQMLMIELHAIEQKISLLETITTVTNVPESESLKTKAIPKQTSSGKETTNPLKAEVLLKNLKDNTDPSSLSETSKLDHSSPPTAGSSKMTILSSNNFVQEFKPDYLKAVKKEAQNYYVIYKGPHAGIHTEWGVTEAFCKTDKVTCKKFKSKEQAQTSLIFYGEEKQKTVLLRPRIHQVKEEHKDQRLKITEETPLGPEPIIEFEEFKQLWNKARAACQEDFLHDRFFTTDKTTKSLYNFIEGADLTLIHQAFKPGLINNIYPSNNLLELRDFPNPMINVIKNFRKKVLKAKDSPIYIKVISTIPDWNQEGTHAPYHFLEIGLAKSKKEINQSQPMEDKQPLLDTLFKIRVTNFKRIAEQILEAISEEKKKVNYADSNCIITSWSFSGNNEIDAQLIYQFGVKFQTNTIHANGTTKQAYCRHASLFQDHYCQYCKDNNTSKDGPTTEDKKSSND
ncbi:Orf y [Tanacetum coccineum]